MKKILLLIAAALLVTSAALAAPQAQNPCKMKGKNPCNPCAKKAQNPCAKKAMNPCSAKFNMSGKETTLVGYIGDSECGLMHGMGMGTEKECTLKCVEKGSHFILADRTKKTVYLLDKETQMKAGDLAGEKVKITGHVNKKAKTIHVTKLERA